MSFSISQLFLDNKPACHACIMSSAFFSFYVHSRSKTVTLIFLWIDYVCEYLSESILTPMTVCLMEEPSLWNGISKSSYLWHERHLLALSTHKTKTLQTQTIVLFYSPRLCYKTGVFFGSQTRLSLVVVVWLVDVTNVNDIRKLNKHDCSQNK